MHIVNTAITYQVVSTWIVASFEKCIRVGVVKIRIDFKAEINKTSQSPFNPKDTTADCDMSLTG